MRESRCVFTVTAGMIQESRVYKTASPTSSRHYGYLKPAEVKLIPSYRYFLQRIAS